MKNLLINIVGCLFIISISLGTIAAEAEKTTPISPKGKTIVNASSKGMKIQAEIGTHILEVKKEKLHENKTRCGFWQSSCGVVDFLRILVNDKSIIVPRSAYCDLSDLNTAEVKIGPKGAVLILEGGDASEGYIVKIEFDSLRVTRRLAYASEIANEPTQETIYNLPVLKDE